MTPAARSTVLPGAQIPPPDRAVDPPNDPAFSTTTTLSPRSAAVSAAVIPAAPLPATTTSNSAGSVSAGSVSAGSVSAGSVSAGTVVMPPPGPYWNTLQFCADPREAPLPDWDVEAEVVVIGFGAAGACAALEAAAAGCSVLILDRFGGGGATALSGGVVYAGGGTPQQRAAGVTDTPGAMLGYLRTEVGDAVPETTLREFCDGSVAMLAWLEGHGVPFEGSLCPDKTSYPTNRHYLYYSGSEVSARDIAPPAPRGHRARGRGTSGGLLYARLAAAASKAGIKLAVQTRAVRLIIADGRVTGVECRSLRAAPLWVRAAHRALHNAARKPYLYVPKFGRVMHRPADWLERRYGRTLLVGAARGVVIAAGGFGANRPMLRAHAPSARGGLPLATPGDDGSGIRLGTEAGGATACLGRVSVWRFLSP